MEHWQAVILAIVEGLTEFLPVSSTGHLILTSDLLGIVQTEFVKSFEIVIQLGAIFAVVVLYLRTLLARPAVWTRAVVAFVPTAVLGFAGYSLVKDFLIGNVAVTLAALFLGGIGFVIFERVYRQDDAVEVEVEAVGYRQAFLIGLCQSVAMVPGVSRSAATIFGGLALGLRRKTAAEFSFILAIPTMAAATGLDMAKTSFSFSQQEYLLLAVGLIGSFITALIAIKAFLHFVQHHSFVSFGVYRILLAALWLLVALVWPLLGG